jgi:hypothetical protein
MKRSVVAASLAFAMAVFGVSAVADAVTAKREGVAATVQEGLLHWWDYVTVCDTKADGNGVYTEYYRDSGSKNTTSAGGNGNCQDSGTDSRNLISRFNACNDLSYRPDPCTDYVYR